MFRFSGRAHESQVQDRRFNGGERDFPYSEAESSSQPLWNPILRDSYQ